MKLSDIKLGQNIKDIKKLIYKEENENFIIGVMPSFLQTKYKYIQNLDTKEKMYVLFENDILINITNDLSKISDLEKADKFLGWILENI